MQKLFLFVMEFCTLYAAFPQEPVNMNAPKESATLMYGEMIQNNDEIFDFLRILFLQNTSVALCDTAPATRAELACYLADVDYSNLNAGERELYDIAHSKLFKENYLIKNDYLSFDTAGEVAVQAQYSDTAKLLYADTISNYNRTPGFMRLPLSVNFSPYINLATELAFQKGFWSTYYSVPYTNIPLKDDGIFDGQMPRFSNMSFANRFMSLNIGRGQHHVTQTLNGSLFLADVIKSLDFASIRFFHKNVNLSSNVYFMDRYHFLFTHQVNFKIAQHVAFRIYEGTTLYGDFDVRYLSPMMIFHNFYGWDEKKYEGLTANGSQLGIGLEIVPYKGLRFYGQFEMNQLQLEYELKHYPEETELTPNSLGALIGTEYAHVFPQGILTSQLEFLYANPWLNILENKEISFIDGTREKIAPAEYRNKRTPLWLSNPLGPDTIAVAAQVSFRDFSRYGASLKYRFIAKGENEAPFLALKDEDKVYYPSEERPELAKIKTPSGEPLYVHTVSLNAFYKVYKNLQLTAALQANFFHGRERKNALYTSFAVEYTLR